MPEYLDALDGPFSVAILASIAFFDAVIGVNIVVVGEAAFLAAGVLLSASGSVVPVAIVLIAAWAGDMTSFFLGRRFGSRLVLRFLRPLKRRRNWRKAKVALNSRGAGFVVVSRLLGPVAWVTPFLAGTMGMKARVFAPAAALGVAVGAGLFVFYGAIGGQLFHAIWPLIRDHLATIGLSVTIGGAGFWVWRRSKSSIWKKTLKVSGLSSIIFLASNFVYFFVIDTHVARAASERPFTDFCKAIDGPLQVSAGETGLHLPQPINIILFSEQSATDLMTTLGWHRNLTFTHDQIGFGTYLRSLLEMTPPVSELYFKGLPADSAFQMPGTLRMREHIRWWDLSEGVHFGAISRTDEIAVKYYGHLPTILHDIAPNVDASRQLMAEQITRNTGYSVLGVSPIAESVPEGATSDYETDGGVLIVTQNGVAIPSGALGCIKTVSQQPRDGRSKNIAQSKP